MAGGKWMIYGAYGYTGRLAALEAVRRGHQPLLAGRDPNRLAPLAGRLGLEWVAVGLDDPAALRAAVGRVELVYHAAGPFASTAAPMIEACLSTGVNYLDLTGEIPVFQYTFGQDAAAQRAGVALISGVGYDVIPSDCLAVHVARQAPGARVLDIAMTYVSRPSPGTARTVLGSLPRGGLVRRAGRLLPWPIGAGGITVRFGHEDTRVLPAPLADLETAYHSTAIPNITTYLPLPAITRTLAPLAGRLLSVDAVRGGMSWLAGRLAQGPDAAARAHAQTCLWARAQDLEGTCAEAWLVTPEPYQLTALAAPRCVERVLAARPRGALTPAQAFGPDFVLEIPGVVRRAG